MKRPLALLAVLAAFLVAAAIVPGSASAGPSTSLTLKAVKDSGAQALTADEVKALVLKGTVNGESRKYRDTIKFFDDGTLKVESSNNTAWGKWSVDPDGVFSMVQNWSKGKEAYEGKIYRQNDTHFIFRPGAADDATWVYVIR